MAIRKENKNQKPKIKLAIVGSRSINNFELLERFGIGALRIAGFDLENIGKIISGGAQGADMLAVELALKYKIPILNYIAEWIQSDGGKNKLAGFERNTLIVDDCDAAIVLWDGTSKGTADTLGKLHKKNKPYILLNVGSVWFGEKRSKKERLVLDGIHFSDVEEWDKLYENKILDKRNR